MCFLKRPQKCFARRNTNMKEWHKKRTDILSYDINILIAFECSINNTLMPSLSTSLYILLVYIISMVITDLPFSLSYRGHLSIDNSRFPHAPNVFLREAHRKNTIRTRADQRDHLESRGFFFCATSPHRLMLLQAVDSDSSIFEA